MKIAKCHHANNAQVRSNSGAPYWIVTKLSENICGHNNLDRIW